MNTRWLTAMGLVTVGSASALAGCGDSNNGDGSGGTGNGTAGMLGGLAGTTSAGSAAGGNANGGNSGSATAGSATAGNATNGGAGAGGTNGGGGGAAGGGAGGASGGGTGGGGTGGGAGAGPKIIYDFETDVQGWKSDGVGVTVATDVAQKVTGAQSLKVTVPEIAPEGDLTVYVPKAMFWPGTVVTLSVYSPAGTDGLWLQAFTQSDNWAKWDTAGNTGVGLTRGGWTTITYTVPQTFPGGLQVLGVQMGVNVGAVAFAGGDFYIDSVTAEGGVESCAGTGTGSYGFEADTMAWTLDGGDPAPTDTAIAHSTDEANGGTGSLKVSFTALPGGTLAAPTARRIRIEKPIAYCTQEVTLNVWMPPGSEGITFQGFSQFNNYDGWNAAEPPAAVTRDGWTQQKYTLPAVGAGGLQLLGVQILNTGEAAFTGDVYIDDVSW